MRRTTRFVFAAAALAGLAVLLCGAPSARAGGPLVTFNGEPVRWERTAVTGPGPLHLQTVDETGRVLYRVDSGTLGPLSNEQAVALVDRIFGLYNGVETSTIRFANAGPIVDPKNGRPIDVTSKNVGKFLGRKPAFENPIIFDSDGDITGGGGVLGFFTFLNFGVDSDVTLREGAVVLNGATVEAVGGAIPFTGVFTHEFGHFAGPLDHEQSNGNIASYGAGATLPAGYSEADAFDLYAPYTETLFPFVFDGPEDSRLATLGYGNSGYFVASLDMDTKNALSNLYPAPGYRATDPGSPHGAISGRVVIRTSGGDVPVTGVNVVARRVGQGGYPAPVGTLAYADSHVGLDSDGFPLLPSPRAATDPFETVESVVTGAGSSAPGEYTLDGLPPGDYRVEIQRINPYAIGGSGIGPLNSQLELPYEESFSGPRESGDASDAPSDFEPVRVTAGSVVGSVDIVLNGFETSNATHVDELEPNDTSKEAQLLALPAEVTGHVADGDRHRTTLVVPGLKVPIHDIYRFTLDRETTVVLTLSNALPGQDADLFLFAGDVGGRLKLYGGKVINLSLSTDSDDLLVLRLPAGDYSVGVNTFYGSSDYTLRVLTAEPT